MLAPERRKELIEILFSNITNAIEASPDIFADMYLSGGTIKGYINMTDEELLNEYKNAYEGAWEHDPREED
jgi:hypothetical protein